MTWRASDAGAGTIIEFLGAPGAGKSTIALELARLLRRRGCRVRLEHSDAPTPWRLLRGRARRLVQMMLALLSAPSSLRRLGELERLLPQANLARRLLLSHYLLHLHGLCLRRRKGAELLILDQGFAQALYSLALASTTGSDTSVLGSAARCLMRPTLVIQLDLDETSLRHRLAHRAGRRQARVEAMLKADSDALGRTTALIQRIGASLSAEGWNVVVVDQSASGRSPQQAAESIVAALGPLLAPAHGPAESAAREQPPRGGGDQRG